MGAPFSKDLRKRALDYIGEGHTRQQAADLFKVGLNSIYRWQRLRRAGESLEARVRASKPRKLDPERLDAYLGDHCSATLKECAREFGVSATAVFYALKKLGVTRKKSRSATGSGTRKRGGSLPGT